MRSAACSPKMWTPRISPVSFLHSAPPPPFWTPPYNHKSELDIPVPDNGEVIVHIAAIAVIFRCQNVSAENTAPSAAEAYGAGLQRAPVDHLSDALALLLGQRLAVGLEAGLHARHLSHHPSQLRCCKRLEAHQIRR